MYFRRKRKWDVAPEDATASATFNAPVIHPTLHPDRDALDKPINSASISAIKTVPNKTETEQPPTKKLSIDATQKAAEAAAKIERMLKAKGLQVNIKPPSAAKSDDEKRVNEEDTAGYEWSADMGKFTRDVDINDSKNRYYLSRKETLSEVCCISVVFCWYFIIVLCVFQRALLTFFLFKT